VLGKYLRVILIFVRLANLNNKKYYTQDIDSQPYPSVICQTENNHPRTNTSETVFLVVCDPSVNEL
jgi:hypothetical protein